MPVISVHKLRPSSLLKILSLSQFYHSHFSHLSKISPFLTAGSSALQGLYIQPLQMDTGLTAPHLDWSSAIGHRDKVHCEVGPALVTIPLLLPAQPGTCSRTCQGWDEPGMSLMPQAKCREHSVNSFDTNYRRFQRHIFASELYLVKANLGVLPSPLWISPVVLLTWWCCPCPRVLAMLWMALSKAHMVIAAGSTP